MPPRILNLRSTSTVKPLPGEDFVFVGRPSPFGNPFHVGNRAENVKLFREWMNAPEQESLRARVRSELRGRSLACFCAPKLCHAKVLLQIANAP